MYESTSHSLAPVGRSLQVYDMLSSWLYEQGSVENDQGREIIGEYLGVPIIKGCFGIDYNFSFSTKAIREHASAFADAFEVGGLAVGTYFMPTYFAPPDEGDTYPTDQVYPEIGFYMLKNKASDLYSENLQIQDHRRNGSSLYIVRHRERRVARGSCQVITEEIEADQGKPGSLTVKEYEGLLSLFSMGCLTDAESIRHEPGWETEIPKDMLLEFE